MVGLVSVSRSGELALADEFGREREALKLPQRARLSDQRKARKSPRKVVAKWDPHTSRPSLRNSGTGPYFG